MVENVTGKVTVKEVLYEDVGNGSVVVYKIENNDDKLPFNDFYIATFDDTAGESVWGAGSTPKTALSSASLEWDKEFGGYNPFREVLEKLKQDKAILLNY
jgi:hypothetical protein